MTGHSDKMWATALAAIAVAILLVLAGCGGSSNSFSDSSECADWSALPGKGESGSQEEAQNQYLEDKLGEDANSNRSLVFWRGMLVNCDTGMTVGEAFASTSETVDAYGLEGADEEFESRVATGE